MMKAPETVMRWRLNALPFQEQYGQRDLPVKLRRGDEKSLRATPPPKGKAAFDVKRGF
jgi:hypothetical protein